MKKTTSSGKTYPTSNRYLILLEESGKKSIETIEKELQLQFIPSKMLNSTTRGFQTLSSTQGILLEHLSIAVVQDVEFERLKFAAKSDKCKFTYFEKDQVFETCNEVKLIEEVQEYLKLANVHLDKLQTLIQKGGGSDGKAVTLEWGITAIGLTEKIPFTGRGVDICVLDTGFANNHPDFTGRNIEGRSFIDNEAWNDDQNGHGTHCVGIAAGGNTSDAGKRYGVASGANIRIGKVLSNEGFGSTSAILDAIDWAISQKFRVISMSLGSPVEIGTPPSRLFELAGSKALDNNCLLIAAAGNDSNRPSGVAPVSSPANAKTVMAVAAIDSSLNVATFSNAGVNANSGGEINVAAPGVNIVSSFPTPRYRSLNGTSMATPFVAGLAALYMEAHPTKSAKQIWNLIENTAKNASGQLTRDVGKGLVQFKAP